MNPLNILKRWEETKGKGNCHRKLKNKGDNSIIIEIKLQQRNQNKELMLKKLDQQRTILRESFRRKRERQTRK